MCERTVVNKKNVSTFGELPTKSRGPKMGKTRNELKERDNNVVMQNMFL
jgi:hypothetical protein